MAEHMNGAYGRAVENGDGLLHIEKGPSVTYCGETFDAYTLHWDTRTVIACGRCLFDALIPGRAVLADKEDAEPERPARTNCRWFHRALDLGATVRYFKPKPKFVGAPHVSPVDCVLLVFGGVA